MEIDWPLHKHTKQKNLYNCIDMAPRRKKKNTTWHRITDITDKKYHSISGIAERQRGRQPKSGTSGGSVSGPNVPAGTKRLGERWGDI